MRISDWSSDVCSSDLRQAGAAPASADDAHAAFAAARRGFRTALFHAVASGGGATMIGHFPRPRGQMHSPTALATNGQFFPPQEGQGCDCREARRNRSEEHTSELQSLMRLTSAV